MNAFISAEQYALAHYYLKDIQNVPLLEEACDYYRDKALKYIPTDHPTLLRREDLQFYEEDFDDEIKEIAHCILKNLKKKLTTTT